MKSNERVIKKGDYYELETIEDLMMQQKIPKKEDLQASPAIQPPNQSIVTELPPRAEALKNYAVSASAKAKTDGYQLDDYQISLEQILQLPIRDEERLEIEKILKEIASIKNSSELPLNSFPERPKNQLVEEHPKKVNLVSNFNIEKLEEDVKTLEDIKYIELSKLQNLVQILLGESKDEQSTQPITQIDPKTKQEIETLYNNLSQLECLKNLSGIVNKIASNEAKYAEICEKVQKTQEVNQETIEVLSEFGNDELLLNQLEENFKKNIEAVRGLIKKLSE